MDGLMDWIGFGLLLVWHDYGSFQTQEQAGENAEIGVGSLC